MIKICFTALNLRLKISQKLYVFSSNKITNHWLISFVPIYCSHHKICAQSLQMILSFVMSLTYYEHYFGAAVSKQSGLWSQWWIPISPSVKIKRGDEGCKFEWKNQFQLVCFWFHLRNERSFDENGQLKYWDK